VPDHRPRLIAAEHFDWDHTTVLNLIALVGLALVVRAARRLDPAAGATHAIDPICGMQVERTNAPAAYGEGKDRIYFCSERCKDKHRKKVA
jgi:YHS domain-containing protein